MKRVRYVIGAAGLAPAALGMLAPGTAAAAAQAPKITGKTVSLQHSSMGARPGAAVASHCVGSQHTSKSKPPFFIKYWFIPGNSTCVGTVKGSFTEGAGTTRQMFAIVHYGNKGRWSKLCTTVHLSCNASIHMWFPNLHSVCTEWESKNFMVDYGGVCRDPIPN